MIIAGKRKRKLDKRLTKLKEGEIIKIGVPVDKDNSQVLKKIGFTESLYDGETVLPLYNGPISKYNSEGKYIIHKEQPMETAYTQREWTWKQWAGYHETETHSRIVDVPYKRYPRYFI